VCENQLKSFLSNFIPKIAWFGPRSQPSIFFLKAAHLQCWWQNCYKEGFA